MDRDAWKLIGICGIYCGDCPSYLAQQIDDPGELDKRAEEMGLRPEEVRCSGCHSDQVMVTCVECKAGFRDCAREHGVRWCFQCPDFPCRRLEDFKDVHVENGISHHEHLIAELTYLRDKGTEAWLKKKDQEGRCPRCRQRVYWSTRACPACGTQIR